VSQLGRQCPGAGGFVSANITGTRWVDHVFICNGVNVQ
jgi:hypothetical protein